MAQQKIIVTFEKRFDKNLGWNSDNISPYIDISDPEQDIKEQRFPDEIVIPMRKIRVEYDYPLSTTVIFEYTSSNEKGFSRAKLAEKVAAGYQQIYREEDEAVGEKTGNVNPYMLNRAQSKGPYGIWGHHIEDLVLHTVEQVNEAGSEVQLFTLGVDS